MEKPARVRLGTRTYFFNLVQSSAHSLFVLDLTGHIKLGEVGIKCASVEASKYLEGLELPADPFDVEQVRSFLLQQECPDVQLVADCISNEQEKQHFALRKRQYLYIVSNESNIADLVLQAVNQCGRSSPLKGVYQNSFDLNLDDVVDCLDTIVTLVKARFETKTKEEIASEMCRLLAGLRLCSLLTRDSAETYLLKRGYKDLLLKYPFLDKANDPKLFRELKRPQAFPNEIIDSYVYLGNGRHVA